MMARSPSRGGSSKPLPLSLTVMTTLASLNSTMSSASEARECRHTFLTASWVMRNRVSSASMGSLLAWPTMLISVTMPSFVRSSASVSSAGSRPRSSSTEGRRSWLKRRTPSSRASVCC